MRGILFAVTAAVVTFVGSDNALAAVTEIHVGDPLVRADLLKPGVHRYIRYTVAADGHRSLIDIWSREIAFEKKDGHTLLHLHQTWDEASPPAVLVQDSFFEAGTLRPLTHVRNLTRDAKTTVSGYRFLPDKIVGMRDLANNSRVDFSEPSPEPTYNWEADMELLQALPLAIGYAASISFYDAGQDPPARYVYGVTGSENIAWPDGHNIDCWLVEINFEKLHASNRFWIDKTTQVLVREETNMPDGSRLVKMLLSPEREDLPP